MSDISDTIDEIIESDNYAAIMVEERQSGMDSMGNTFLYEFIGLPIVNNKGLLKRVKGSKININTVTQSQMLTAKDKWDVDFYDVTILLSNDINLVLSGDIGRVALANRLAIRLAGYKVVVS